ncbi:MAG TPA: hypothetical protein DCY98_10525 [Nitrospinae bacterium]|nr:hypothetical protein [Nitrospinota bacterium]
MLQMRTYVYKNKLLRMFIAVIDSAGYFLKKILFPPQNKDAKQVERILIFKVDHAGDVLLATPAIIAIRKKFPLSHIVLVVGPWSKGIIEGEKYINEVISYSAYWQDRNPDRNLNIRESFNLIRILRRNKYDMFFDFRGDLFAIIIGFLSGIPKRIGYGWEGGGFLLTHEVNTTINKHQVEILLDAVRAAGIEPDTSEVSLSISEDDKKYVLALLKQEGWIESSLTIGFHIGGGCPSKMWPIERFADLMEMVYGKLKAQVVLIGGTEDVALIKKMERFLSFKPIVMAGKTTFKQTAAAIKMYSLFIGNDSAPVHIAAAVGVTTIVLFSAANDWQRWKPYGNDVVVVHKDVPCGGCEESVCDTMECMNLITVKEVFDLVLSKSQNI